MDSRCLMVLIALVTLSQASTVVKFTENTTESQNPKDPPLSVPDISSANDSDINLIQVENSPRATFTKPQSESNVQYSNAKQDGLAERSAVFDHPRLRPRPGTRVDFDDSTDSDRHKFRGFDYGHQRTQFKPHVPFSSKIGDTGFHLTLGGYQRSPDDQGNPVVTSNGAATATKEPVEDDDQRKQVQEGSSTQQQAHRITHHTTHGMPNIHPSPQQQPVTISNPFGGNFYGFQNEVPTNHLSTQGTYPSSFSGFMSSNNNMQSPQTGSTTDYNSNFFPGFGSNEIGGFSPFDPNANFNQASFPQTTATTNAAGTENPFAAYAASFGHTFQPDNSPGLAHYMLNQQNKSPAMQAPGIHNSYQMSPTFNSHPAFFGMNPMQFGNNQGQFVYPNVPSQYGYPYFPPATVPDKVTAAPDKEMQRSETESQNETPRSRQGDVTISTPTANDAPFFSRDSAAAAGFGQRLNIVNDSSNATGQHQPQFMNNQFYGNIPWLNGQTLSHFPPSTENENKSNPNIAHFPSNGNGFDTSEYFRHLQAAAGPYGQVSSNSGTPNFFLNYPARPDVMGQADPQQQLGTYGGPFLNKNASHGQSPAGGFYGFYGGGGPSSSETKDFQYQQPPSCSRQSDNSTICFEDDNYPRNEILYALETESLLLRRLIPSRMFREGSMDQTKDQQDDTDDDDSDEKEEEVCDADVKSGRPLRARNVDGKWKVLVNVDGGRPGRNFFQKVHTETCKRTGEVCTHTLRNVPTKCVQKFNVVQLLSWEPQSGLHVDAFEFPVACSCQIVKTQRV